MKTVSERITRKIATDTRTIGRTGRTTQSVTQTIKVAFNLRISNKFTIFALLLGGSYNDIVN